MFKFNFEYLTQIAAAHGLSGAELAQFNNDLPKYLDLIKSRGQGFYEILDDAETLEKVKNFALAVKGKYRDIIVLGIGGSALGASCLQQALGNMFGERTGQLPRLTVLDNIDPVLLDELEKSVDLSSSLFLVITKSGGTPETLAQYLYFKNKVELAKLNWLEHFVFVTDPTKGLLRKIATENPELPVFEVPENVGGRFSVLTTVGLLPAALMGIDIGRLIKVAKDMRDNFLLVDAQRNLAFQLAVIQYLLYQKGKVMTVMFPYAQKLSRLADWYRQLLAESIGKAVDRAGKQVNIGITPVVAMGATDQHSQNQLYNEGPNDKFYIFLEVLNPAVDLTIPNAKNLGEELAYLDGVTFQKLLLTEMEGTIQALLKQDRPMLRISLDSLDAGSVGGLLVFLQGSVAFLGELFGINTYDQPGVELSKILTKELLKK